MTTNTSKFEFEWFIDKLPFPINMDAIMLFVASGNPSKEYTSLGAALENSFVWNDYGYWMKVIETYDPEYYDSKKEPVEGGVANTYTNNVVSEPVGKPFRFTTNYIKDSDSESDDTSYTFVTGDGPKKLLVTYKNTYLKFHNGSMMKCFGNTIIRVHSYHSDYYKELPHRLVITTDQRDLTSFEVEYPSQEMLDQALSELSEIIIKLNEPKE